MRKTLQIRNATLAPAVVTPRTVELILVRVDLVIADANLKGHMLRQRTQHGALCLRASAHHPRHDGGQGLNQVEVSLPYPRPAPDQMLFTKL